MKLAAIFRAALLGCLACLALTSSSAAQEQDQQQDEQQDTTSSDTGEEQDQEQDNSGTNPINFQREIRVYNDYSWLDVPGDGNQNLTTVEFRTPFAGGKWQWRIRARHNALNLDLNDDGTDGLDESGFGDVDMRFLTVLHVDMAKKQAVAVGLELQFDTASERALGSGATSLGPQVFYVKFMKRGLFAPGLQYKFSLDEETVTLFDQVEFDRKVEQILVDLNFLVMAKDKQSWFFTDPQIVVDIEKDREFVIVDLEVGAMMSKWTDLKGHSIYVRPSFGVGADRPLDYSVEVGYKIVGF